MTTFIKDLIDVPERVQRGDFALRLSEGVNRPEDTLRQYVVTPELERCFDDALTFIRSSLQTRTSKASYLHGSFGSGKSHFMAVLHLILQGNPVARGIPELASVISKHAQSLGYDALILFLDELILWLASRAADLRFVHQEGQKLAKLVEAQTPDWPVDGQSRKTRGRGHILDRPMRFTAGHRAWPRRSAPAPVRLSPGGCCW